MTGMTPAEVSKMEKQRANTLSKGANPMAYVVYRGVPYDTELRRQQQAQKQQEPQQYNESYRGVKFIKSEGGQK